VLEVELSPPYTLSFTDLERVVIDPAPLLAVPVLPGGGQQVRTGGVVLATVLPV